MKGYTSQFGKLSSRPRMTNLLIAAFDEAWAALRRDLCTVPLANWNESVFRYMYIRALRMLAPAARCQKEWHAYDLLAQHENESVLVEFKFYITTWHDDLNGVRRRRPKGFPSKENFQEFCQCVSKLETYNRVPLTSRDQITGRYLLLVYSDHPEWPRDPFSNWYDDLQLPAGTLSHECLVELHRTPPLSCPHGGYVIRGCLFHLTPTPLSIDDLPRLDRKAFSVVDLDRGGDERDEWFRRTPRERIAALELLRQEAYGRHEIESGLRRVLEVAEFPSG